MSVVEDGRFWIQNADTKAAFLAAFLGLALAGSTQQTGAVRAALHPGGAAGAVAAVFLGLFAGCLLASSLFLIRTQMPSRNRLPALNRFSFPTIAGRTPADLAGADPNDLIREAWEQSLVLARIAARKYGSLRHAMVWAGTALLCFLAWTATAAVLVPPN